VAEPSAGAPDDSVEDMSMLLVESACQGSAAQVVNASRSSGISLNPSTRLGADSGKSFGNVVHARWQGKQIFLGAGLARARPGAHAARHGQT
ncbi:MAG TPA: hypothetical protein VG936_00005, partial [Lacunisphaera sp.]|nr:hypothetical protein [Lacunisphaera sp.]